MQAKRITMPQISSATASDTFEGFLLTKRAKGAKTKTLETYRHHFRAIGHHLGTSLNISELDKKKYEQMISSSKHRLLTSKDLVREDPETVCGKTIVNGFAFNLPSIELVIHLV